LLDALNPLGSDLMVHRTLPYRSRGKHRFQIFLHVIRGVPKRRGAGSNTGSEPASRKIPLQGRWMFDQVSVPSLMRTLAFIYNTFYGLTKLMIVAKRKGAVFMVASMWHVCVQSPWGLLHTGEHRDRRSVTGNQSIGSHA
jgi:hypothetical protein